MCAIASNIFAGGLAGADILNISTGGRALGLGGAYTSAGDDVETIYYNPAGISLIEKKEFFYNYIISFADVNIHSFSYAQQVETPFLEGKGGISIIYRTMPDIKNEDAQDIPVKFSDMAFIVTYANSLYYFINNDLLKNFIAGLNVKFIMETLGEYNASAFAFDIGTKWNIPDSKFKLGLAFQNIGFPYKYIDEESPMPFTVRIGSSVDINLDKDNDLKLALDYIHNFYDTGKIAIGLEDNILNLVFLRAGYNISLNTDTPSSLALGAGIAITQFDITVALNYVWKPVFWIGLNDFDSNHILSLQVKF